MKFCALLSLAFAVEYSSFYREQVEIYRNLTNISDDRVNILLEKHSDYRRPIFHYNTIREMPAPNHARQVNFEQKVLNVNSMINTGIFLCQFPGIYRFESSLDAQGGTFDSIIRKNDRAIGYTVSRGVRILSISIINKDV